jgi:hypothetical protein
MLLSLISGIVFLGTPHGAAKSSLLEERVPAILNVCSKNTLNKPAQSVLKDELSKLSDVATRFEDMNFRVGILSVFEEKQTKAKSSLSFLKQKNIVVSSMKTWRLWVCFAKQSRRSLINLLQQRMLHSNAVLVCR